jgi:hypothetical protein
MEFTKPNRRKSLSRREMFAGKERKKPDFHRNPIEAPP